MSKSCRWKRIETEWNTVYPTIRLIEQVINFIITCTKYSKENNHSIIDLLLPPAQSND
jgi:hypothetical protein